MLSTCLTGGACNNDQEEICPYLGPKGKKIMNRHLGAFGRVLGKEVAGRDAGKSPPVRWLVLQLREDLPVLRHPPSLICVVPAFTLNQGRHICLLPGLGSGGGGELMSRCLTSRCLQSDWRGNQQTWGGCFRELGNLVASLPEPLLESLGRWVRGGHARTEGP